jgi:hypothetical protein
MLDGAQFMFVAQPKRGFLLQIFAGRKRSVPSGVLQIKKELFGG